MRVRTCIIGQKNFDSKENGGKKSFSYETKAQASCTYPNKENMFMVPNHEKNRDYYVNA